MTTDFDILEKFYQLINVTSVTDLIDGEIWTVVKPVGRQVQDVVINALTNSESNNNRLNVGIININIFAREMPDRRPNAIKLKELINAVYLALNIEMETGLGSLVQLNYKIESQKTFRDNKDPLMYFANIRLNFSHKN